MHAISLDEPVPGRGGAMDGIIGTAVLAALFFLPPGLFFLTDEVDSHADGLAIACGLSLVVLTMLGRPLRIAPALIVVGLLVMLHFAVASLLQPLNLQRGFLSLALMWLVFATATIFSGWFFQLDDKTIGRIVPILLVAMFMIGLFNILEIQPAGGRNVVKPIFPFTEPGHFGPILTPVLLFVCARTNLLNRSLLIGAALALAYTVQSLTLLVGTIMTAIILLPGYLLVAGGIGLVATVELLDLEYFAERLDFSLHSTNLSVLAYLEGWEFMASSMERTGGWGIGFQQLGWVPFTSPAADAILRLTGQDFNLTDGTFVAAKFVSEFGLFAIPVLVLFVIMAMRAAWSLRRIAFGKIDRPAGEILAMAFICSYGIDAFVRGVGWFTGTTFMLIAALLHYVGRARRRKLVEEAATTFAPGVAQVY
ncbi:MAG TPA: hypothetical protein VEW71_06065 [Allosphingosinicella sp.]|nr:hypothetical protein [Allosphingosinicella sp.]